MQKVFPCHDVYIVYTAYTNYSCHISVEILQTNNRSPGTNRRIVLAFMRNINGLNCTMMTFQTRMMKYSSHDIDICRWYCLWKCCVIRGLHASLLKTGKNIVWGILNRRLYVSTWLFCTLRDMPSIIPYLNFWFRKTCVNVNHCDLSPFSNVD